MGPGTKNSMLNFLNVSVDLSPYRGRTLTPREAMELAIALAYQGAGLVSPNPMVGCVILDREQRLLSTGYHAQLGGHHAEINALENLADEQLNGASLFVTLEPCSHKGRTPSCAKHLAKLPLSQVIYGMQDPNPLVSGKGALILKEAGKEVFPIESLVKENLKDLQEDLHALNEVFFYHMQNKIPFVAIKAATSLDGQMASLSGESQWITNDTSREWGHYLRGFYDATIIGRGTFESDNPTLNIRSSQLKGRENRVVVIDPQGKTLESFKESHLYKNHNPKDIFIGLSSGQTPSEEWRHLGVNTVSFSNTEELLKGLYQYEIYSLLIEGGPNTLSRFIKENFAQRFFCFQAPILLGAGSNHHWTQGVSTLSMNEKTQIHSLKIKNLESDFLLTGKFETKN